MRLSLLRHGSARDIEEGDSDSDRLLNREGIAQINQLGGLLKASDRLPLQIVSSEAKRAKETAEIIHFFAKYAEITFKWELYHASSDAIHDVIRQYGKTAHLLYVGHNPGISEFATHLSGEALRLSTGMCAHFAVQCDSWAALNAHCASLEDTIAPAIHLPH